MTDQTAPATDMIRELRRGVAMIHDALADPARHRQACGEVAAWWLRYADACVSHLSADSPAATDPDPITVAARLMLDNEDAFMGCRPCDGALQKRVARAAVFGAAAYEAASCMDNGTYAMMRSILTALIDPLHPDLDYLREVPEAGAKAREARNG